MKWTCKETQKTQDEFRVTIHDGSGEFRLQLQGNLGPAESREVESCWRTAASTIGGRRFIVDLYLGPVSAHPGGRVAVDEYEIAGPNFGAAASASQTSPGLRAVL